MWTNQAHGSGCGHHHPGQEPPDSTMRWLSDHLISISGQLSHLNTTQHHLNTSQQHIFSELQAIKEQLAIGDKRMDRMELMPARHPPTAAKSRMANATETLKSLKEFGQAVASFKEWLGGAVIVAGSATAVSNPDPAAAVVRWLLALLTG